MYTLKPIVTLPPTNPCTNIIYHMPNIHGEWNNHQLVNFSAKMPDNVITEQVIRLLQEPLSEYSALEIRQEKVLNQLAELRKQVSTLRDFLKLSNKTVAEGNYVSKKAVSIDLLIKTKPSEKPFLFYALEKLWKDTYFRYKTYVHSSIKEEVPDCFPAFLSSTARNVVNVMLIWKDIPCLEVFMDLHSEPIIGEVNLLRYLYRMLNTYDNDQKKALMMDNVLDMCHVAYYHKSNRILCEKILCNLRDTIDEWSGKDEPNIADIAVWSTLKKFPSTFLPRLLLEMINKYDAMFMTNTNNLFTEYNQQYILVQ